MTKAKKIALNLTSSLLVMANFGFLCAIERVASEPYSEHFDTNMDEAKKQILTAQLLTALHDVKKIAETTRAPRPSGTCAPNVTSPEQPVAQAPVLQQIKGILCQLKSIIGEVDHEGTYMRLLDEIECGCDSHECLPEDYGDALALLAKALTEVMHRIGCPECDNDMFPLDLFGDLCYISSQVDIVESNIDGISSEIELMDSKIDAIDSKVDIIESNIAECSTVIGTPADMIDCDFAQLPQECDDINNAEHSIVQWLKAIFIKCNQINNCVCNEQ